MVDELTDKIPEGNIVIGAGVAIQGSIKVPGHAYVDGSFEGELNAKVLVLGQSGRVSGQINVETAEIGGAVHKDLNVKSKLSLRATGSIDGAATYSTITIEEGGKITGTVEKITQTDAEPAQAAPNGKDQKIASIAMELTDDGSLPKVEREHRQIDHAASISDKAKLAKLSEEISTLRDIASSPLANWNPERKRKSFNWAARVVDQVRGIGPRREALIDIAAKERSKTDTSASAPTRPTSTL